MSVGPGPEKATGERRNDSGGGLGLKAPQDREQVVEKELRRCRVHTIEVRERGFDPLLDLSGRQPIRQEQLVIFGF